MSQDQDHGTIVTEVGVDPSTPVFTFRRFGAEIAAEDQGKIDALKAFSKTVEDGSKPGVTSYSAYVLNRQLKPVFHAEVFFLHSLDDVEGMQNAGAMLKTYGERFGIPVMLEASPEIARRAKAGETLAADEELFLNVLIRLYLMTTAPINDIDGYMCSVCADQMGKASDAGELPDELVAGNLLLLQSGGMASTQWDDLKVDPENPEALVAALASESLQGLLAMFYAGSIPSGRLFNCLKEYTEALKSGAAVDDPFIPVLDVVAAYQPELRVTALVMNVIDGYMEDQPQEAAQGGVEELLKMLGVSNIGEAVEAGKMQVVSASELLSRATNEDGQIGCGDPDCKNCGPIVKLAEVVNAAEAKSGEVDASLLPEGTTLVAVPRTVQ